MLESCLKEHKVKSTVKRLIDTRWSARHDAVSTIKVALPAVIAALEKVILDPSTTSTVCSEVQGILKFITSFKFLLQTCVWSRILSTIKTCLLIYRLLTLLLS